MVFFKNLLLKRRAKRAAETQTENFLIVIALVINGAIKTSQISGAFRLNPEDIDKIEDIIFRHPNGSMTAVEHFFNQSRPRPNQMGFSSFLRYAPSNCGSVLEDRQEALKSYQEAMQIERLRLSNLSQRPRRTSL